jgi:hypothetical protein
MQTKQTRPERVASLNECANGSAGCPTNDPCDWCASHVQQLRKETNLPVAAKAGDFIDHPILGRTEVISVYTRAQAIEDGVLCDMTQQPFGPMAQEAGIKWPIAVTNTVFNRYIDFGKLGNGQGLKGRWWDVCWMLRYAMRRQPDDGSHELRFTFYCQVEDPTFATGETCDRTCKESNDELGKGVLRRVTLKCVSGPGDQLEPCLTIMALDED